MNKESNKIVNTNSGSSSQNSSALSQLSKLNIIISQKRNVKINHEFIKTGNNKKLMNKYRQTQDIDLCDIIVIWENCKQIKHLLSSEL